MLIDRSTIFGNEFHIGRDGTREEVISKYEDARRREIAGPDPRGFRRALWDLRGKTIGCTCKPKACHGDVLVRLVAEFCTT